MQPILPTTNPNSVSGGFRPASTGGRLDLRKVRPMEAVAALYSEGQPELANAILSSFEKPVFEQDEPAPVHLVHRILARLSYRLMKRTTVRLVDGVEEGGAVRFRNRLLERSGHPYARTLLAPSSKETEALVEGGDPMNGPYLMIVPEIRQAGTKWDRLFFNSAQARDVQMRFILETRATYEEARRRLDNGGDVRLKALAAGTGLSMILAYDRLVREGYDAGRISARITDREPSNTGKTNRLLRKLASARGWRLARGGEPGIVAETQDIFHQPEDAATDDGKYHIVTAVGILEYLQGFTCETTEQRHALHEPEEPATAAHLAERFSAIARPDASLILNTFRPHSSTRVLELFGKRFDYRHPANLSELLSGTHFSSVRVRGSGLVYDVVVCGQPRPESLSSPASPV
jgi:hypothetical protein